MQGVPHHLLDVANPNDTFTLVDFQRLAYRAIDDIHARGKKAFLVGGTGLYINSIVDGYNIEAEPVSEELRNEVASKSLNELIEILREKNPAALSRVDLQNKRRVERAVERAITGCLDEPVNIPRYETLVIGVTWPRDILYKRIAERLDRRLEEGMIDEVKSLRANGATDDFLYKLGLEYRYILMYLRGEFESFDAFYDKLFMEIRHLAKEQMTWFRKRKDIHWIDMQKDPVAEARELIDAFFG